MIASWVTSVQMCLKVYGTEINKALVRFIGKVIPQQRTVYEMLSDWLDKRGGQRPRILQNLRRPFGAKREGSTK